MRDTTKVKHCTVKPDRWDKTNGIRVVGNCCRIHSSWLIIKWPEGHSYVLLTSKTIPSIIRGIEQELCPFCYPFFTKFFSQFSVGQCWIISKKWGNWTCGSQTIISGRKSGKTSPFVIALYWKQTAAHGWSSNCVVIWSWTCIRNAGLQVQVLTAPLIQINAFLNHFDSAALSWMQGLWHMKLLKKWKRWCFPCIT